MVSIPLPVVSAPIPLIILAALALTFASATIASTPVLAAAFLGIARSTAVVSSPRLASLLAPPFPAPVGKGENARLGPCVGSRLVVVGNETGPGLELPGGLLAASPCGLAALERLRGEPSPPAVLRPRRPAGSPSDEIELPAVERGSLGTAVVDAPTAGRLPPHCLAEDPDSDEESLAPALPLCLRGERRPEERPPRLVRSPLTEGRLPSDSVWVSGECAAARPA